MIDLYGMNLNFQVRTLIIKKNFEQVFVFINTYVLRYTCTGKGTEV